ncbi:MAG: bifunctional DNA primase/polymerase, partial [Actinomycetota bacterium]|nr:bifunctional DNA primase/polymerase [Actinomycetota bacterium]
MKKFPPVPVGADCPPAVVGDRAAPPIRSGQRDAALELHDRGWAVYNLPAGSKQPHAGSNGFKDATRSRSQVEEIWTRHPGDNIGIATGPASGIVVLDVDVDPEEGLDGRIALRALEAVHGPLPETFTVRTRRGGLHLYFQLEPGPGFAVRNSTSDDGLDVRGTGGYVVGPGSVVGGRPYTVVRDIPVALAPDWLLARMLASSSQGRWDPSVSHDLDLSPNRLARTPSSTSSQSTPEALNALPPPRPLRTGVHCARESSKSGRNGRPETNDAAGKNGPGSGGEAKPGDRLANPAAIARVLEVEGRPGVKFGATSTEHFRCLVPGHADRRASATLFRGDDGRWLYRCHTKCNVTLTMAELHATVTAGKLVRLGKKKPSIAAWLWRAWHEAGIDPVVVPELDLQWIGDLTPADRRYAEGFTLLKALRDHHGDLDDAPYALDFAGDWCRLSRSTVQRAARKFMGCGWLRVRSCPPGMRCGFLYDVGPVVPQNDPNLFATTIAWATFRDDGTRTDSPTGRLLDALVAPDQVHADLLPVTVERQEGETGGGHEGLPVGSAGVEGFGTRAVDEGDDLPDVAEMPAAKVIAGHGVVDASSGTADG